MAHPIRAAKAALQFPPPPPTPPPPCHNTHGHGRTLRGLYTPAFLSTSAQMGTVELTGLLHGGAGRAEEVAGGAV